MLSTITTNEYYKTQSKTTSPGRYAYLFDDLNLDISELCQTVQGLILHFADEHIFQYNIPKHRFKEMDNRFVEKILHQIVSYNDQPLNYYRNVESRVVGACRDYSLLLCSILRQNKIPARLRVGFINYVIPNIYMDHMCIEYWNITKNKWCLVDVRTSPLLIEKLKVTIDFNLHDLPTERFISASNAWKMCRENGVNPNKFGSRMHRGLWYVRNRLIQDLAVLNKKEVLIWDVWGMMLNASTKQFISDQDLEELDKLSDFINNNSYDSVALQRYYQDKVMLKVPELITNFNPYFEVSTASVNL